MRGSGRIRVGSRIRILPVNRLCTLSRIRELILLLNLGPWMVYFGALTNTRAYASRHEGKTMVKVVLTPVSKILDERWISYCTVDCWFISQVLELDPFESLTITWSRP